MSKIRADGSRPNDDSTGQGFSLTEKVVEKASLWLFSTAIHCVLLIVLALLVPQIPPKPFREIILQPNVDLNDPQYAFHIGDPNKPDTPTTDNNPVEIENPVQSPDEEMLNDPVNVGPEIENPHTPGAGTENPERTPIHSLYEGRSEEARQTLLLDGGGDETTEAAVLRGLHWLARQQYRAGYWSLRRGPSNTSYDATLVDNWVAATGMALLAFQGYGVTCERGQFQDNVVRGWSWLLMQQDDEGCFYRSTGVETHNHPFYTQGICTIAICELYAMTKDPAMKERLRLPAQKAIDFCVKTQTSSGGWRYGLNGDESDLAVTGWVLAALKSGRIAGLDVPQETFDRITAYLDDIGEGGSKYPYLKGRFVTRSMTAEGLLCRQFLGWDRDDPRLIEGANWLIQPDNLVCFTDRDEMGRRMERDAYYWYYATQMFHHLGGPHWKTWNDVMKQRMCENQHTSPGENEGSWNPILPTQDKWAEAGRLYVTCLSIYTLQVYYRHLPIYRIVP